MNRGRLRMRVTAAAEGRLRAGHPWLFAECIREQNRPGELGELAVVYDRHDRFLAIGLFDPASPIRLRVLQAGEPQVIDVAWWHARLQEALARRAGLFDQQTTGFRWINGESDGWPGLVLDRYEQTLVLKLYTVAWLPRIDEIDQLLNERLRPERIVLRLSRNVQKALSGREGVSPVARPRGFPIEPGPDTQNNRRNARPTKWRDGNVLSGVELLGPVLFKESGLRFEADVVRGQKTGFFLDQRDNRRKVGDLARGWTVLNAFSFSGGFSLYSARGGARSVTELDISPHALEAARRNFRLNESIAAVAACRQERIQADAFEWLGANAGRKFDRIILDPPSLAKREAERAGAVRAYGRLAALGIQHLSPGGILVACSCSAHVTAEEFFGAVRKAAAQSRRKIRELETTGQPPDHPARFKEADYLKAIYLRAR